MTTKYVPEENNRPKLQYGRIGILYDKMAPEASKIEKWTALEKRDPNGELVTKIRAEWDARVAVRDANFEIWKAKFPDAYKKYEAARLADLERSRARKEKAKLEGGATKGKTSKEDEDDNSEEEQLEDIPPPRLELVAAKKKKTSPLAPQVEVAKAEPEPKKSSKTKTAHPPPVVVAPPPVIPTKKSVQPPPVEVVDENDSETTAAKKKKTKAKKENEAVPPPHASPSKQPLTLKQEAANCLRDAQRALGEKVVSVIARIKESEAANAENRRLLDGVIASFDKLSKRVKLDLV